MRLAETPPREFSIDEGPSVPWLGLMMGGAAMVPLVLLVAGLWLLAVSWSMGFVYWLIDWGCLVLGFLAGVRRGLSFRTPGGERPAQIVTVFWLFGLTALALFDHRPAWRLGYLLLGFASLAVLDPLAARRAEAPLFFARLRPLQMLVPVFCLAVAELWVARHG